MKSFSAQRKRTWLFLSFVLTLALLSGCAGPAPQNSPTPGATVRPTSTVSPTSLPTATPNGRVSQLGKYEGYSQALYSEWVKTSQYVTVRDGTKLAVDIYHPAQGGKAVDTPLPVIWTHTRYHREEMVNNEPWLQTVLKHGYVIASVDVRGSGASYGTFQGPFSPEETRDAYDITEWLAAQPWSDGKIGMYGRSYLGMTQYMAASAAPPHLKAIFPEMAAFDFYSFFYPGGVFHDNFLRHWGDLVKILDATGVAVDEDADGAMLREARKEHAANVDVLEAASSVPYRDSVFKTTGALFYNVYNPAVYLEQIKRSGVAVYHWSGWYDMWPRDALLWYSNLTNPQKIVIGPWAHTGYGSLDLATEQLRWYDYWLKGIDNGVMSEAPIYYYTLGSGAKQGWHSAWQWPLPDEKRTNYYFSGENAGSIPSVNDGSLSLTSPATTPAIDDYRVNYSTTTGIASRWVSGYGGPFVIPEMFVHDRKGLTYTTPPLTSEVEVTGHPVVHLWVTSTAKDGDFFVYLEDVTQTEDTYITEGTLRASHRALSTAPYNNNLGLPYHRSFAQDIADFPNQPVELVFDLLPTSYSFGVGHRIRITITCADKDNTLTPQLDPPPTIHLYREAGHASYIVLPIIPNQ
ncbi:MAG: CocE/NonD family hydrolase [Anaerolineales bacterium]